MSEKEEKDLSQMENRLPKKERWENLSLAKEFRDLYLHL